MSSKQFSAGLKDKRRVVQYGQRRLKKSTQIEDFSATKRPNLNFSQKSPESNFKRHDLPFSGSLRGGTSTSGQQMNSMTQSAAFTTGFG